MDGRQSLVPDPLLADADVTKVTALGRSKRYELIRVGKFPAPVQLTEFRVAWRSSDIQAWIDNRPVASAFQDIQIDVTTTA